MSNATDAIEQGLRAWARGDLDAVAAVLGPAVTLRAATPGPWDCEGRAQVLALLREREETRDPEQDRSVDVRQVDEHTFVVHSASGGDTATRITVADGKVVAMQQFTTNP